MIHFPDKTLQRYTLTHNTQDLYGADTQEYEYDSDILVDFQNETRREIREQYGVEKDNIYKIYFDKETSLNSSDELREENGTRYAILGEIMEYKHFHDYKKAYLVKKR